MAFISFFQKYHFLTNRLAWIFLRSTQPRSQNTVISVGGASVFYQRSPDPLVLLNLHILPVGFIVKGFIIRDLSEISRRGGEIRWPIPSMGVKFANPPLKLGLKYHDPPHLTELKEKCSRLFKVQHSKPTRKKGNKNNIKGKQKKARAKRMEANCEKVIETIAPQQESHNVTEPIGPLSLHYEGISRLLKKQRPYIQYIFEKGCSPMNNRKLSSNIYAST